MITVGKLLDYGYSIIIFPEGTRSLNGKMNKFKNGIGVLAQEMEVPIIPIKIHGNFEILPKGKNFPKKGKTEFVFGRSVILKKNLSYIESTEILENSLAKL